MEDEPSKYNMLPQSDHDLLIRVDTTLGHLRNDVKSLTDQTVKDIDNLKRDKLDKEEAHTRWVGVDRMLSDHERRLRRAERYIWIAVGALLLFQLILLGMQTSLSNKISSCCSQGTSVQGSTSATQ